MDAETIVKIVIAIASFLVATLIPSIVLLIQKWKAAKSAKTEAEKQSIISEMKDLANELIVKAEETYRDVHELVKAKNNGVGLGAVKKESVMTGLQAYCNEKGIAFDKDYWSNVVDELVAVTKQVN